MRKYLIENATLPFRLIERHFPSIYPTNEKKIHLKGALDALSEAFEKKRDSPAKIVMFHFAWCLVLKNTILKNDFTS